MNNLIITIFLGYLGTYRFSKKQYTLGLIYLFTVGLFGIGWLYDIYLSYMDYKKIDNKLPKSNASYNNGTDNIFQQSPKADDEEKVEMFGVTFDVELKDYASERIEELIKEDISNKIITKEDLYEGYSNEYIKILGKTYQTNNLIMDCEVKQFKDSKSFGVYLKNISGTKYFIGYLPKEEESEYIKIAYFEKILNKRGILNGGKYKEYDKTKFKVVTKKEAYKVDVYLTFTSGEKTDECDVLETYIAGIMHDNEDGESRREITKKLKNGDLLFLEECLYKNEKAVKIITQDKKLLGWIPAMISSNVYEYIIQGKIQKVEFTYEDNNKEIEKYRVKIFITR